MTFRASLLPSFLALAVLGTGSVAQAGSCPVCTTSSECTSFDDGGVAFCVLHSGDVGCGSARMICCPGQGCNTFSGRPSCEGTTCTVVENLVDGGTTGTDAGTTGTDAGTGTDSGTGGTDSGTPDTDSGGTPVDAGGGGTDAGGGAMDAGGTTPPPATSSCGCRAGARAPGILGLVTLAGLVLARLRRR